MPDSPLVVAALFALYVFIGVTCYESFVIADEKPSDFPLMVLFWPLVLACLLIRAALPQGGR